MELAVVIGLRHSMWKRESLYSVVKFRSLIIHFSLRHYDSVLHKRTQELKSCIFHRRDSEHILCLNDILQHWSYDVMVGWICAIYNAFLDNLPLKGSIVFGPSSGLELMKNGDEEGFIANGQLATAAYEMCVSNAQPSPQHRMTATSNAACQTFCLRVTNSHTKTLKRHFFI